jgi:hypothetical protein
MHGLILLQLQKFAQHSIGAEQWQSLLKDSGFEDVVFSAGRVYDDQQVFRLVEIAAKSLGIPVDQAIESFGRFLSTELVRLYQRVIKPEWKTLDIIENTETFIHSAVRVGNPGAMPPPLDAIRTGPDDLQLLYSSERKLCRLAIGIIKGLADHFHEIIEIQHDSCMLLGDPFCTFQLKRIHRRHDTEQMSLNSTIVLDNTFEPRETLERDGTGKLGVTMDLKQGKNSADKSSAQGDLSSSDLISSEGVLESAKKTTIWEFFLQPAIVPSDVASIGPYRLVAKQGEGGMGAVFQGIDTRTEQSVAIKIVHPRIAENENSKKRFLRETHAVQLVKSPHVVEVREVGEISGLPYMVMEFLRGMSVQAHRERFQSLPVHEILRIAIETVAGLTEVHRCGIIHRDLKPENLWVESPSLQIKIIDFGLARDIEEEMRLTRSGSCLGTPSYMSPEQALGERIDFRSDFFSLGCVLYELTTGMRPFEREGLISTLNALTKEDPRPPIELVEGIPRSLSDLTISLLTKKPDGRPANCSVLSKQLTDILNAIE